MPQSSTPATPLRERIRARSVALRKSELLKLPLTGETVLVCSLMLEESERVGELGGFKATATMIALGTRDPETKEPIWNPNNLEHIEEIGLLPHADAKILADGIMRLSNLDAGGARRAEGNSPGEESGNGSGSSSPGPAATPASLNDSSPLTSS